MVADHQNPKTNQKLKFRNQSDIHIMSPRVFVISKEMVEDNENAKTDQKFGAQD